MFVCELLLLTNLTAATGSHRGAASVPFCSLYTDYCSPTSDCTVSASIITQMTHSYTSLLNHLMLQPIAYHHCTVNCSGLTFSKLKRVLKINAKRNIHYYYCCEDLLHALFRPASEGVGDATQFKKHNSQKLDYLNYAQVEIKGWKCARKISPTMLHHQQDKMLIQNGMDADLYAVYAKFSPHRFYSRTHGSSEQVQFLSLFNFQCLV